MKIGILTYHRAENYGALLQAYALKSYLSGLGHDVSFVDYWPEYHVDHYRLFLIKRFKKFNIKGKINYIIDFLLWGMPKYLKKHRLQRFMYKRLSLGKKVTFQYDSQYTGEYDVVVYGSDQIWRKQSINGNQFNYWYFGSTNVCSHRKITYAASMGVISLTQDDDKFLKNSLKQFNAMSVREQDLRFYLNVLGFNSQLVCDPTFLLAKEEWKKIFDHSVSKKKFILFYNLLNTDESVRFAECLSRKTGLPIKEINMHHNIKHAVSLRYITTASVECFLKLIYDAEYVVSNSFHGVAFSIIFEKQFWAVGMGERANRVLSLLESVGLSERYVELVPAMIKNVDYNLVRNRLQPFVETSKQYLSKNIKQ